jgi:hypothetical protein
MKPRKANKGKSKSTAKCSLLGLLEPLFYSYSTQHWIAMPAEMIGNYLKYEEESVALIVRKS